MNLKAPGQAPGNDVDMTASMEVIDKDDGGTIVAWERTADVSGTSVGIGGRAIKSVTNRLVKKYFSDMKEIVEEGEGAESKLEMAPEEKAADIDVEL